ncbi:MAG: type IV toxin-antitoxin system AbiEi family antitoxin domain-containing protein [Nocardioidaceae bacterium]|nr:type IV toxin-antitoxin system AbiEi family antitoxin domain-containing protein [Nocardioidaceae bacterium]MCL2613203.1 type IV toxin-antitoxin system AbiEi family antitoxin domain-containing protein [Nocardioidaceae bacterium]
MFTMVADAQGIVLRSAAIAAGLTDHDLWRARKAGQIVRMRQGAYALTPVWHELDRLQRVGLVIDAVRQQYADSPVALSHASACVVHGGPTWDLDLSRVLLTNLAGRGERKSAGVTHHRGLCLAADVTRDERGWLMAPARAALDTAAAAPLEAGIAVADWYLNRGLATREELDEMFARMRLWPGTLHLHRILHLCDGSAESVGETRTRLLLRSQGLPAAVPQLRVTHPNGRLVGRVDFAWPEHRTMLEFDGLTKYHRYRRPGESIEEMVIREKLREDRLRELTGWMMIRLVWADLASPATTADRIRRCFDVAARDRAW